MQTNADKLLVIAISSRALFDLEHSNNIYEQEGVEAYRRYQIAHESAPLARGGAFAMVQKLLALQDAKGNRYVEIVLISRNSADTGLRIFKSIEHYELDISRAVFASGESPFRYAEAFDAHLFLSAHAEDVRTALEGGIAAAQILSAPANISADQKLRIAFDGDSVLFSDVAEKVFQEQGLEAFQKSEQHAANQSLPDGPFKKFLTALHHIQQNCAPDQPGIRTALITARAAPAHERVIKTLRGWNIRIDESCFLGGMDKGAFLQAFGADIFFDDQQVHCDSARRHVTTGHVPHGIKNAPPKKSTHKKSVH